jgi:hypothetical protein
LNCLNKPFYVFSSIKIKSQKELFKINYYMSNMPL